MRELIIKMANTNIGSLCLFLKNIKNSEYLDQVSSYIPPEVMNRSLSERIYYYVNEIKETILCDCGRHRSFLGFKNGYRPTCGNKQCYIKKRKETCIEKYGVDNPKKSKEIIEKEKNNIKKKWGGEHYMLNKEVKDKFNKTMLENHGVNWAQQSKEIASKSKETFNKNPNKQEIIEERTISLIKSYAENKDEILLKRMSTILKNWNGEHYMLDKDIKERIKKTFIDRYGFESPFMNKYIAEKRIVSFRERNSKIFREKMPSEYRYIEHFYNKNKTGIVVKIHHDICNGDFDINDGYLKHRLSNKKEICLHCNPVLSGISNMELELLEFIKENYNGEILVNKKTIIKGELDIYLPDINLAFEFNGLYWHSDIYKERLYHYSKTKECYSIGIQLIHIWEDDWIYKIEIVKSIILNKLNMSDRIFARKCVIKIVSNLESRKFLEENHIQGFVGSKVKIGLYYNEELVSLMTFGGLRRSLGQINKYGSYELLRFCNKKGLSVVGGASKLFTYFLNNFDVHEIISYSDNSRSNGNLYEKLGFVFSKQTVPNYYYIIDGIRKHRFNFRKDKLVKAGADINKTELQIMADFGHSRIFDCGSKKWIYKK